MSLHPIRQVPLSLGTTKKHQPRSQFGAICYRRNKGRVEILLITSRGKGRWILPKGWPIAGSTPARAAAIEAYEEAGVQGRAHPLCLGIYGYKKGDLPCVVALYALEVTEMKRRFPEAGQRKRRWVTPKQAAAMVDSRELGRILERFSPELLPPADRIRLA
ncbi:NUDIX hydrolase [Mangrovicoccus algicola]|uniref:NUDIX hydrolase n=1 Tax=Mangrovicoccus algicola TaxID=2771008 RepID=A0A8J6YU82_9RHOB|nr:NUDIX hydrolase [Mangrovicoccus algicola]MBE3637810.1 NUDIX hydrolase [Mangrovicoccus algicola]